MMTKNAQITTRADDNLSPLVISSQPNTKLSQTQIKFNNLVAKLEKFRKRLQDDKVIYDAQLDYYLLHIQPLVLDIQAQKIQLIKVLYPFTKIKKTLIKSQRTKLLEIVQQLLNQIPFSNTSRPDEEISKIIEEIAGKTFDEVIAEEMSIDLKTMKDTYRKYGIDVGDDTEDANMSQEEIARVMAELREKARQAAAASEARRAKAKSKKQQAIDEKNKELNEIKNKSIAQIYKQLVKVLHPDLEQDEAKKPIKEELMKQLSVAYKNNDLHGLLMLELAWIQREENNISQQTDDKLKIYNQLLTEQVHELNYQVINLVRDPRYQSLRPIWGYTSEPRRIKISKRHGEFIHQSLQIQRSIQNLQQPDPAFELMSILYNHSIAEKPPYDY
jgi:hypothetical protein